MEVRSFVLTLFMFKAPNYMELQFFFFFGQLHQECTQMDVQ